MANAHTKMIELPLNTIPENLRKYFKPKRKYGVWTIRNVIIWRKPNCMPSSVKDRMTVDFEPILMFSKNRKYFFDMPRESSLTGNGIANGKRFNQNVSGFGERELKNHPAGRAMRTVWDITTQPFKEAHFATFPEELPSRCIKAGCPEFVCNKCGKPREKIEEVVGYQVTDAMRIAGSNEKGKYSGSSTKDYELNRAQNASESKRRILESMGQLKRLIGWSDCGCNAGFSGGVVLDPFAGAGTTCLTARKLNRNFIGFELNPDYVRMAERRIKPFLEQQKLV